jgi:O-antigen ligase
VTARQRFARFLTFPDDTHLTILLLVFFYCGHLFFAGFIAPSELGALFAMTTMIVALRQRLIRPSFHILYFPLFLYGVVSTVSVILSGRAVNGVGEAALWMKMMLFPTALIMFRQVPRSRLTALWAMLAFGIWSSAMALRQFVFGQRDLEHRIAGPTTHVMTFSGLLLPISLIFLILWLHNRRSVWFAVGTLFTSSVLLLTFTRSIWLGWLCATATVLVLRRPRFLLFAAPAFVLFLTFLPMPLFSRVVSSFDTRQESNLDRIRMLEAGVEIIKDFPLLGVGPVSIKEVYPLYRKHDAPRLRIPHLHNNLVQLWAERGVLAPLIYFLLLGLFLRECARSWNGPQRRFAEIGVAVTVGLAVAGLFEFNFGDTEVFWMMLDVYAIVIASLEQPRPSNEAAPLAVGG